MSTWRLHFGRAAVAQTLWGCACRQWPHQGLPGTARPPTSSGAGFAQVLTNIQLLHTVVHERADVHWTHSGRSRHCVGAVLRVVRHSSEGACQTLVCRRVSSASPFADAQVVDCSRLRPAALRAVYAHLLS